MVRANKRAQENKVNMPMPEELEQARQEERDRAAAEIAGLRRQLAAATIQPQQGNQQELQRLQQELQRHQQPHDAVAMVQQTPHRAWGVQLKDVIPTLPRFDGEDPARPLAPWLHNLE